MAEKTEAYIDTSAFISLLDRSDSFHATFLRLFAEPPKLYTTPLVLAEGHGWFLRRYDSYRALQFLDFIDQLKPLKVLSLNSTLLAEAATVARRFADQTLTLADALGLHLMAARETAVCWSTDFHLGITGVPLVIHQS